MTTPYDGIAIDGPMQGHGLARDKKIVEVFSSPASATAPAVMPQEAPTTPVQLLGRYEWVEPVAGFWKWHPEGSK